MISIFNRAIDAPRSYSLCEITVDILIGNESGFLSVLCPKNSSVDEVKRRIRGSISEENEHQNIEMENIVVYYCGERLDGKDNVPSEVFDSMNQEDSEIIFKPRLVVSIRSINHDDANDVDISESDDLSHQKRSQHKTNRAPSKSFKGVFSTSKQALLKTTRESTPILRSKSADASVLGRQLNPMLNLEEELKSVECEQYYPVLSRAGIVTDEYAFVCIKEDDLMQNGMWISKKARVRILILADTIRRKLGLSAHKKGTARVKARKINNDRRVHYAWSTPKANIEPVAESLATVSNTVCNDREVKTIDERSEALIVKILRRTDVEAANLEGDSKPAARIYCCSQHEQRAKILYHEVKETALASAEIQLLTVLSKAAYHGGEVEFLSQDMLRALVKGVELFKDLDADTISLAIKNSTIGHICDIHRFAKQMAKSYFETLLN